MRKISILLLIVILVVAAFGTTHTATAQAQPFAGVELNVLTFTGPQIAEPLQRRAPDFQKLTGAKVNIVTVPFADLYQSILKDQATGTNSYQAFVMAPQWMVDYIGPGYLQPLDDYIAKDTAIKWDDVGPFFRDFSATFGGKIYTIPLDGDFHMAYYRIDVLQKAGLKPPKTWDEYLDIAKAVHGQDMNGDGAPDFGSCISKKRGGQAYWWITSIAGPYIQSKGTSEGAFFDTETFKPLISNEGFIRALEIYKETGKYGPPNELTIDVGDTRGLWNAGRCAMTLDWGDIGTLAIAEGSKVVDKTGSIITPGSTKVIDRKTGALVACDAKTCPHAVDSVNYAPFASFGGWSGAVSAAADQKVKDAAYAFLSYMSAPEQANVDVTIGKTGFNPYRISQFKNLEPWIKAGMSEAAAKDYLGAIQNSLNSPNMILDLRVPKNQEYQGVILDTVLSQFLAGEFDAKGAAEEITKKWEALTEELGREAQLKAYIGTLGVKK
jgi:multiple sugar transport system substrate-binding protein